MFLSWQDTLAAITADAAAPVPCTVSQNTRKRRKKWEKNEKTELSFPYASLISLQIFVLMMWTFPLLETNPTALCTITEPCTWHDLRPDSCSTSLLCLRIFVLCILLLSTGIRTTQWIEYNWCTLSQTDVAKFKERY